MTIRIGASDMLAFAGDRAAPAFDKVFDDMQAMLDQFGITDDAFRLAHFIAQVLVETGSLRQMQERMNYTSATRIALVWPRRFLPGGTRDPMDYTGKEEKLANAVYGGRMGNDDVDDGYRFLGRGLLQLTGKTAYTAAAQDLQRLDARAPDLALDPDQVCSPAWALKVAATFWHRHHCNGSATSGKDAVCAVTRRVNGGFNQLAERKAQYLRILPLVARLPLVTR
jgi:putative chitinase